MSWRLILVPIAVLISSLCGAQQPDAQRPEVPKPGIQALVTIREHATGGENVTVRMIQLDYPAAVLREQMARLSAEYGNSMRGLRIESKPVGSASKQTMLMASFVVDGVLAPQKVNIAPFLRAFTGAPEPFTVENVQIILENVAPDKSMVQRYDKDGAVHGTAQYFNNPPSVEYRIKLETQDPKQIDFPQKYEAPAKEIPKKPTQPTDNRPLLIGLFVAAGIALGALVYFALTRPRGKRG